MLNKNTTVAVFEVLLRDPLCDHQLSQVNGH